MNIIVSKDIVKLNENHSENHYGEYNVNECVFEFDEYFDSVPVKKAIFTSQSNNKSFEIDIINNKCTVPHEVLTKVYDTVILGVYGYDVNEETLLVRYSPEPTTFVVHEGSYREGAEQPEMITPTQYDMYSKALQEGLAEVDKRLDDVEKQGDYASEQGDYAKEQGDYAKEQGTNAKNVADDTQKKAEEGKFNGKSLEFIWQGTKLGVRLEGQEEYHFVDLQGKQGEIGATGEPFKIKKTYASVSEMNADFRNMVFGDYVMIASSVNEEDNAKLYTRGESAWIFISDFSGAMGIRGETGLTPNIKIGEVKTLEAGNQAKVTRSGSNEEPVFNFELPKGDKGDDYVLTEDDKVEIGEKVNTEYEKRITENEKDIIDIESYLDSLTPKATAKGELVHITDALNLPTFENKVDGNAEQETTRGVNLIDKNNYKPDYENVLGIDISNLVIGETYTFSSSVAIYSMKISNSSYNYSSVEYYKNDGFKTYTFTMARNSNIPEGTTQYLFIKLDASTWVTDISQLGDLQIEKGSTATEYEPYTGGQASPNPDYQQPIEVLEGYNEFNSFIATKLEGQTGELQIEKDGTFIVSENAGSNNYFGLNETLGELCPSLKVGDTVYLQLETTSIVKTIYFGEAWVNNQLKTITQKMLDTRVVIYGGYNQTDKIKVQVSKAPNEPYIPYGYIGYKVNGKNFYEGSQDFSGTWNNANEWETDSNTFNGCVVKKRQRAWGGLSKEISVEKGKQYTFSLYAKSDAARQITIYIAGGTATITPSNYEAFSTQNWQRYSVKFTCNESGTIKPRLENIEYISGNNTYIACYQLEEETITDYEPYQEQIVPLDLKGNWVGKIKDTDIEDILCTDKKRLWLIKNVNRGLISIDNYPYETDTRTWFFFPKPTDSIDYNKYTTNGFSEVALRGETKPIHFNGGGNLLKYSIAYNKSQVDKIPTNDEIKELVDGKYFYYQLAEPQIIELGELPEPIKTFEGVNNIQLLANLDTEIEVKYALDVKKYFDNKLASIQEQIL